MADTGDILGPYADSVSFASEHCITITVKAPDCAKQFTVPRDIICSTSDLFNQKFSRPEIKTASIEWTNIAQFGMYLNWLSTGIMRVKGIYNRDMEYHHLSILYYLGVFLKDRTFRNAVISGLLEMAGDLTSTGQHSLPNAVCIGTAYSGRNNISPSDATLLQKTLVEMYAREEDKKGLEVIKDKVHRDFLRDLSLRLMDFRLAKSKSMAEVKACEFHEHIPKEKCEKQEPTKKRKRED